jgi:hypothetical protein
VKGVLKQNLVVVINQNATFLSLFEPLRGPPGRRDGAGTDAGTDANSKSPGFTGLGTMGRLYTPKPPPSLFLYYFSISVFSPPLPLISTPLHFLPHPSATPPNLRSWPRAKFHLISFSFTPFHPVLVNFTYLREILVRPSWRRKPYSTLPVRIQPRSHHPKPERCS